MFNRRLLITIIKLLVNDHLQVYKKVQEVEREIERTENLLIKCANDIYEKEIVRELI